MRQRYSRTIRVFLSSTFQDLQVERDYLVRNIFPAIRKIAKSRNVDFDVVDLRWGVTEEEAHTGKVIEVCLDEIEKTQPFFIGLLGNRYGWCPDEKDVQLSERLLSKYPFVLDSLRQGMSITEIEMRYGVLNNKEPLFANFYIRDTADTTTEESPRLAALRSTIEKQSGESCKVWHFSTPKQLGRHVYDSLLTMLDKKFPEEVSTPILALQDKQHFLVHEMQEVFFNEAALQQIDRTIARFHSDQWCLLVTGKSGEGKTALVCNWRKDDRRIIRTILNAETNTGQLALELLAKELESRIYDKDKLIWIIDGIEHLQTEPDRLLIWLQQQETVKKVILTTGDEVCARNAHAMAVNSQKEFAQIQIQPTTIEENQQIIAHYLEQVSKKLTNEQLQRIAEMPLFSNKLLLLLFLQELVLFGSYEKLDAFIQSYQKARTPEQLLAKIFNRIEDSFGVQPVQTFFGMLAATHLGLTEADLQQAARLNAFEWASLSEAVDKMTIRSNAMLSLHPLIREIAAKRYFGDQERVEQWREQIIAIRQNEYRQLLKESYRKIPFFKGFARLMHWLTGYMLWTPESRLVARIEADEVWQYLELKQYVELARRKPLLQIFNAIECDVALSNEFYRLALQNPKWFMHFLHPATLYFMARVDWPNSFHTACVMPMLNIKDGLEILKQHVDKSWIPIFAKWRLINYIDAIMTPQTNVYSTPIEDTWAATELDNINVADLITLLNAMPYIAKERAAHIDTELENLIARYHQSRKIHPQDPAIPMFYAIKSYCSCAKKDYEQANYFFSMAVGLQPQLNRLYLLRFMIALGLNDRHECNAILSYLQQQPQTDDTTAFIYLLEALELLKKWDTKKLFALCDRMAELAPDDKKHAHTLRRNMALIFEAQGSSGLAGYMYQLAFDVAPDNDTLAADILNTTNQLFAIKMYANARELLNEKYQFFAENSDGAHAMQMQFNLVYSYLLELQDHYQRRQIKHCFEQYEKEYEWLRKYDRPYISEDEHYLRRINHAYYICQASLRHHIWAADDKIIQEAGANTRYFLNRYSTPELNRIYAYCFFTARKFDQLPAVIRYADETIARLYAIESTQDAAEKEKACRQLAEESLDKWNEAEKITLREKAQTIWIGEYEPYILPFLQEIAADEKHPKQPLAIASMILYACIIEDERLLATYQQMAQNCITRSPETKNAALERILADISRSL